jgi:hypothetical protein
MAAPLTEFTTEQVYDAIFVARGCEKTNEIYIQMAVE